MEYIRVPSKIMLYLLQDIQLCASGTDQPKEAEANRIGPGDGGDVVWILPSEELSISISIYIYPHIYRYIYVSISM